MSELLSDFFSATKEVLSDSPFGKAHNQLMNDREYLYSHNVFTSNQDDDSSEVIFAPTPVDEQYIFLAPYESGYEVMHDVVSLFYKPLLLSLRASVNFAESAGFALQIIPSFYHLIISNLPLFNNARLPQEISVKSFNEYGQESKNAIPINPLYMATNTFLILFEAVYTAAVWMTVDTSCAALSLIGRTLTSIFEPAIDRWQEWLEQEDNPTMRLDDM